MNGKIDIISAYFCTQAKTVIIGDSANFVFYNIVGKIHCRVLLNVIYTMVETLRTEDDTDTEEQEQMRENFRQELRKCKPETILSC